MERLRAWITRRAMVIVLLALMMSTGAIAGSLLGSAKRSDALYHLNLIRGAGLAEAVPGQFYLITETGDIREPLCKLKPDEFEPSVDEYDLVLTNSLGDALPLVLRIWDMLVPLASLEAAEGPSNAKLELRAVEEGSVPSSRLLRHNRRILGERRERDVIMKDTVDENEMRQALAHKDCGDTVRYFVKETGFHVCQLRRVVDVQDQLFGVNFATLCLARMGGDPVLLPELDGSSLWARAKSTLDLINAARLSSD